MTSKGGQKQQVTLYYMSQHFGICTPADALRRIVVNEKLAWSGSITAQSSFGISNEDLFGGPTKQGGVAGVCYYLPGAGDQILPDNLAQKLGRANGADCPGYRGLASVFMTGPADGQPGFYWTANDPYLPGVWVTVQRAPVGLTPSYAMIPRPGTATHPYKQPTATADVGTSGQYADNSTAKLMVHYSASTLEWFDLSTMTYIGVTSAVGADGNTVNMAMANDGTVYWVDQKDIGGDAHTFLFTAVPNGPVAAVETDAPWFTGPTRVFDLGDGTREILSGVPHDHTGFLISGVFAADALCGCDFCEAGDETVWGLFEPTGSSNQFTIKQLVGGSLSYTVTGLVTRSTPSSPTFCHVVQYAHWFVVSDGKWYTINDHTTATPGTIKASGAWSGATNNLPRNDPAMTSFWSGFTQVSLKDASTIRTVDPNDWVAEDTSGQKFYDQVNNAIWVNPSLASHETIRLLDRGELDANPAHVIYEALTNVDWGMGSPSSLIDVTSFEAAGVELFNEPLGLSLIWTRQAALQDFIQEILDHIQGVLFVDPQAGLLTLKLIRGDYDVATLPSIGPSTANLSNFGRKLWGDIVNEVNVTWTNPDNEQDETVTAHDLASITTQGGIVSDSRNYYGVRYSDLAMRLAARDLRSAGAPLATCDAEVDRSLWFLRPASVLLLDWPQYGLDGVVMRVTSIDYGKPGDPTIKLSLIEDVFGLDVADYVAPPSTLWNDPAADPTPVDQQAVLTLPYYLAKNSVVSIEGAAYPEVLAGVLAASSNTDTFGYELWGEITLADGSTQWQSLTSLNLVGYGQLAGNLPAEATSTGVSFSSFVGTQSPKQAGFAIIGNGTEAQNELALITGASTTFNLSRGVLDTVPKAWAAGTPVWFIGPDSLIEDPDARSAAEIVSYRLRTRTSRGLLSLFAAPELTYTLTDRPWLPSRPANVHAYATAFTTLSSPVDASARPNPWVTVTWSNRNRISEDSIVLSWAGANVTGEVGQTTKIIVLKTDGSTVLATHAGLTGTSFDVPDASFGTENEVVIRVSAERTDADGTFESLQSFDHFVRLAPIATGGLASGGAGAAAFTGAGNTLSVGSISAAGVAAAALSGAGATLAIPSSYRSSRIAYTTGSTATITLPSGAAAGDLCVVGYENAWNRSFGVMSGWTGYQNLQGANISGEIYTKVLTSGDVAAGSVSIPLDGSYDGIAFALCFVGGTSGVRTSAGLRNTTASTPRTITTDSTPQVGDIVVLFGAVRDINMTVSLDTVSTLQATNGANASGALGIGVLTAAGVNSFTAHYATGTSGDYTAALIIAP